MRRISRQSSRLANTSQIKCSSIPRQRVEQQHRPFHASVYRPSDPRPPGASSDSHTPVTPWKQTQKAPDDEVENQEQSAEQEDGESKNTSEVRKPAARRILRQRRGNDVPKPPPIPDWFLRHNVKLVQGWDTMAERRAAGIKLMDNREGTEDEGPRNALELSDVENKMFEIKGTPTKIIQCIDTETGHVLFSLDHYQAKDEQKQGTEEKVSPGKTMEDSEQKVEKESLDLSPARSEAKSLLGDRFFVQQSPRTRPNGSHGLPHTKDDHTFKVGMGDPLKWAYLEAETSIRAAFSLSNNNQPSSLFATDRVDISLQCPDPNAHEQLDEYVHDLAKIVSADVIQLDANDIAELTGEYVGQGSDTPGSFSNLAYEVYDGYTATGDGQKFQPVRDRAEEEDEDEVDEDEEADDDEHHGGPGGPSGNLMRLEDLQKMLHDSRRRIMAFRVGVSDFPPSSNSSQRTLKTGMASSGSDGGRDDARLTALLDNLLNATSERRQAPERFNSAPSASEQRSKPLFSLPMSTSALKQSAYRMSRRTHQVWLPNTANMLHNQLQRPSHGDDPTKIPYYFATASPTPGNNPSANTAPPQTIVYVRDLRDIYSSRLGENIIRRLVKAVRKRRRSGERFIVVGTTAQDVAGPFHLPGDHTDDFPFRSIAIPPFLDVPNAWDSQVRPLEEKSLEKPAYNRILEINLRHVQSMLRRMRPNDDVDVCSPASRKQLNMAGTHFLTERVLSHDQVQRLALGAVGLTQLHARSDNVHAVHVALAAFVTRRADHAQEAFTFYRDRVQGKKTATENNGSQRDERSGDGERGQAKIDRVKSSCNTHETRLLTGVVDSEKIRTGFGDVHAPSETIDALKSLTSLSLLRPDAFKYGVLANDRLPGLLLYGPPGTGKTLLAKAVAKESRATVLEVSGAQIYEKYVGEGEKMVRAVFSLAKKLSPCVVFIDEADAIFGSRSNAGNRNTHREIINQFLREWDGMDDHSVFMMVASNRPFDLDDAVLRRLPRRLLVDLPVAKDRESILGIHLRNEVLDSAVSLSKLAEQTPFYSGSDLKNLAVSAALACVREENDLAELRKEDTEFKLPEKRTLMQQHFEKALAEISASISEDMSSLTAIRKFDEQYGDRKGRRKKTGYGFGTMDGVVDESAVRVRQMDSPSQPPPAP